MKRRARRVTLAAAVLGVGVLAVLVVVRWGTTRDHVEAWHFQLTRETETIEPDLPRKPFPARVTSPATFVLYDVRSEATEPWYEYSMLSVLRRLVDSGQPVIFSSEALGSITATTPLEKLTAELARMALESSGYRILEQRFPRRAFVVISESKGARDVHRSVRLAKEPPE